jgi:PKD repeat protein
MRNRISAVAAILVGVVMTVGWVLPTPVRGYQAFMTTAQVPYTWNLGTLQGGTIQWQVADGTPQILHDSMVVCTQAWSDATSGVVKFAEGAGGIKVDWDPNGTMIVDPVFLAYTTFNADATGHISMAHLIVNASNYTWQRGGYGGVGAAGPDGKRQANLDAVMLHELGHALGLDHSDKNPSAIVGGVMLGDPPTMNSIIYPNAGTLHQDDIAGIRSLYNSGAPAVDFSPLQLSATPAVGKAPLKVVIKQAGGDDSTAWDFGDGASASGNSVKHRFVAAGTYTVKASCGGRSSTMTIQVNKRGRIVKVQKAKSLTP